MANAIDLVVGTEVKDQIATLMRELTEVDAKITAIGESAVKMNTALGVKDTASLSKLSAENAKLNKEIEKLTGSSTVLETKLANLASAQARETAAKEKATKATTEAQIAEEKLITAKQKNADTTQKNADKEIKASQTKSKYITQETIDIRLKNKELAQEYTELSKNAGAYDKHDAQYKKMAKSLKDMAFEGKAGTKEFIDQEKALTELGNRLKSVDAITGSHTRNVGNYASSWNGLGNSINQLTREAPAFANSLQTGFMALSNNIPILTDELGVLISKNKSLQEQGKPTESILKTVAGAFFSWQTVISLGVTILTVYGAKIWEALFGLSELEKSQKAVNDEMSKINSTTTVTAVNLKILSDVVLDVSKSEKDRKIALNELKDIIPELDTADINHVETLKEVIFWTNKYIEASVLRAQADYLAKEIAKDQTELDILKGKSDEEKMGWYQKSILFTAKFFNQEERALKVIKDQIYYEEKDLEAKVRKNTALLKTYEIKASGYEQELKGLNGSVKANEAADKAADKIAKDAAKAEKERKENEFKGEIADLENKKVTAKNRLELFKGEVKDKIILSMNLASKEIDLAEKVYQYNVFLAEKDKGLLSKATSEKSTAIQNAFKENIERAGKFYNDFFKKADDAMPKSIFGDKYKMTDEQKADLKAHEDLVKKTADEMKSYLSSFGTEFASKAGFSETFNMLSGNIAGFGTDAKTTFVAVAESAQEMFNMIAESSQASFDQEYARLDKQKETSLKFAGDSTVAKEKIEADYEKKKKEIQLKEFKQKQKITLANIAIDTAQAIVSTWAQVPKYDFGISATALTVMIGAMGAIQAGMVLAQKPPAYAEGTDNHSGGLMLVNDGAGSNFQEKVILPSGKVIRPQGRNVLMDAPKGTKVLNHEQQLFEMLQSNNISMPSQQSNGLTYDEMNEIFQKNLGNIKTQNTIFDKNGFQSYVKNGNSITRSNSNRSQAIGISV